METERLGRAWLAWHAGFLSQPHKRFPSLEDITGRKADQASPRRMRPDQIEAVMNRWAFAMAGSPTTQPPPRNPKPKPR